MTDIDHCLRSVGAAIAKTYVYVITAMGQYTEDAMCKSCPEYP